MSRPSRFASRGKRDRNHTELASVYEAAGWLVQDTSSVGGDCGDTFVRDKLGRIHAREFKTLKGKLGPKQASWLCKWGGVCIRTVDDVLRDIRVFSR